jgi:hypothetical protein
VIEPSATGAGGTRVRRHAPRSPARRVPRSRGQRVALAIFAGLATALILLVLDGAWAGRQMFRGVAASRSALTEGSVAAVTGDPEAARPFFEDAADAAASTSSAASHPSIRLASRIPWLGDNIRAVEAVADASDETAQAGLAMVQAADTLGWQDLRLPATEAIGSVDLPTLRAATPSLDQVAHLLGIAAARLQAADTGRLVGPVAAGYNDALDTLVRRAAVAADARDVAHLLPGFLGSRAPRSYLLAVQTLGVPQGTGGRVDLVGTLSAVHGRLRLGAPLVAAGEAFASANLSPDGPTSAGSLLAAASEAGLGDLDGVVLVDSIWLEDALWVTGMVEIPGRARPLTSDGALDVLEREVFEGTDPIVAEDLRANLASAIVSSFLARRPATEAFAIGLAGSTARRHLMLYSTRPKEQDILVRLQAAGAFGRGPNPLAVTWRSLVENHAVVFASRSISHMVSVQPDGSARVRTVIELSNGAPDGPPSALVGTPLPATLPEPGGVDPVGGWAAEVRVLLPRSADRVNVETSIPSETQVVREGGIRVAVANLATDPGDSMTLIVTYTIKHAVHADTFRMTLVPQPTLAPESVQIRIDAPSGATISDASEQLRRAGGTATWSGKPTRPMTLSASW